MVENCRYLGQYKKEESIIILMEHANARSIDNLLEYRKSICEPVSEKHIIIIFSQISNAITYMHTKGVLHRYLAPHKVFLNSNGTIKVGIVSKMMFSSQPIPHYLNPEVCLGKEYNEKSDVWAIGCILYELATFQKPFECENFMELIELVLKCKPKPLPELYSKTFSNTINELLKENYEQRPSAKYIYETIVPNLLKNLKNTPKKLFFAPHFKNGPKEYSMLFALNLNKFFDITPIELPRKKIVSLSVSKTHFIAVASDHSVYTWGEDQFGQLGHGETPSYRKYPICIDYFREKSILSCTAGEAFSIFLDCNGLLYSCGDGKYGCLGHGNWNSITKPKLIESLVSRNVKIVKCGTKHVVALDTKGALYAWGSSKDGQLGLDNVKYCCIPTQVLLTNVQIRNVFAGEDATILIAANGNILATGNNAYNKLGITKINPVRKFTMVAEISIKIKDICIDKNHTVMLTANGDIIVIGLYFDRQVELKKSEICPRLVNLPDVRFIACGLSFLLAIDGKHEMHFWGSYYRHLTGATQNVTHTNVILKQVENERKEGVKNYYIKIISQPTKICSLFLNESLQQNKNISIGGLYAQDNNVLLLVHHS
ncbi:serine/threonine-protein kinase Nek8 isoform X2 [Onthophagus taurus]|uniref:serine/threonine-protein kinase Nek8 isoform X2 n=1 Tax=Onthophagus taurus TaxID=166361 RepID=UPI000C20E213|nr:serine/threonine-protein kinase Nek8 [Onthophagus taurus]XP_022919836.1 serine/threonine-protein kinase Nek8 [Onthophagus taurus]